MRICLLCNRGNMYSGGQGVYIHYLAKEYTKMGHEVDIIVGPPYPYIEDGVRVHKIPNLNLFESQKNFLSKKRPFQVFKPLNLYEVVATRIGMFPEMFTFGIRSYLKLRDLVKQRKFDIIHDNQTLAYGNLLMKSLQIPMVATVHHPLSIDRHSDLTHTTSFKQKWGRIMFYPFFMQNIVARRMDRVITVSNSSADKARKAFKIPQSKLRVVYNGVDTDIFKKRDDINKEPDSLIVATNTRDRNKGIIYLLQALTMMRGQVKLTIVDDKPPCNDYAPGLVKQYGLEDMVTFTGRLSHSEVAEQYATAKIAVSPSIYEGFGLPAAEAMACGVPIIGTTAGALPEVIEDNVTGILVPPKNPQALAQAIKTLIDNPELRCKMGIAGVERVKQRFTWSKSAKTTLDVYREVIGC
ncbi:glycosyltransferase family 4 protein [Chloroflexota bacterium]